MEANGSGTHFEVKSRGNQNRNGIVENVSEVRDVEAPLEILLELGLPIRIIEIGGGALLRSLRRHAELFGHSARLQSAKTRICAEVHKKRSENLCAGE